jgi:hypothetical protein
MATFKKKEFKNIVIESKTIDEFVNDDGGVIGGDEKYNKGVDVKTGPINMPGDDKGLALTTNKHAANAIQPRNWWWSLTYGYGQGTGRGSGNPIASNLGESEAIDESELTAEQRMRKMVEDIIAKKSNRGDIVKKGTNSDVNRNNVPDIEDLGDTQMIIVGKLKDLIDSMDSTNMNGEELGIVLNYFLSSVDTTQIPYDYKTIIRKKI